MLFAALGACVLYKSRPRSAMHDYKLKSWSFPLKDFFQKWPLVQQILNRSDGTGVEAMSEKTRNLKARIRGTKVARSICPYCAVGCGQLIHHKDGQLVSIEGDPASPISRGHLCPKGSASFELLTHPNRLTKVLYRKPRSKGWEAVELETAMDMVADRVWEAREKTFEETRDGQALMQTTAIAHLGGATLDNEENYLIKKLFAAGLGMVCISNQARI
jgi:formate dehydrogenase major subunit